MGRGKLNMELISNEKSRNITLKKRKEGLIRKMQEFTTLCDVKACMIIYTPNQIEAEIWPQNADQVHRIIDIYKSKAKDSGNKSFGVPDFFHERKRKIEEELAKLRRKNLEAKYPTVPALLNVATETQLTHFSLLLADKAKYVRSRLQMLRNSRQAAALTTGFYYPPPPPPPPPPLEHMIPMNENINLFETIQFKRQLFFESAASGYWPPPPQPYMPPPQQHFSSSEEFIEYQMRNHYTSNAQDLNSIAWPNK
ncbi:agamous-like MADS-box protein AGL80 [Salvia miltiorrhiza]|uniref:agamous-like MADS-box protein AGL80 n=1 Tax=Salvia miltiorrhiza TaxID=226208 RepID=UPI0025AD4092|nr:agamous-like MADS-box protein AGL80 [Salvia miltiorrhiza]